MQHFAIKTTVYTYNCNKYMISGPAHLHFSTKCFLNIIGAIMLHSVHSCNSICITEINAPFN